MDLINNLSKNRNYVFFAVMGLIVVLILFSYQRSISQQASFVQDRQLNSASVQAYLKGDFDAALDYLQRTSATYQQDWNYYYLLGSIYMEMGSYEKADTAFTQAEETAPMVLTMSEYLTKRGQVFIHLKQKNDALDYLNHSLGLAASEEERKQIQLLISQAQTLQ